MGDLYVHVRMKECCRATLKDLDKRKKKARFEGGLLGLESLFEALGNKTIDEALNALLGGGKVGGKLEELTAAACVKVSEKHAALHEGKGETEEGAFWHQMIASMTGKPAAKKAGVGTTPGAHGMHKGRGYVVYADGVKVGGTRAWRNNNPGNIEAGPFATSHGAIGSDGRFAIFPDEATGKAAIGSLVKGDKYKNLSIADAMAKYAPPKENDTKAYVAAVSKSTGLDATRTMGSLSDEEMAAFTGAVQQQEGWRAGETVATGAGW